MGMMTGRYSVLRKLMRKMSSFVIFLTGIFCFVLGLFILAAFVPKIWDIFREVYRGDLIALLIKEDTLLVLLYTVLPVGGIASILFAMGFRFIKHNYVYLYLVRLFRLLKASIRGEISYRVTDMKGALLSPLRIRELFFVLALISIIVAVFQYLPLFF
jgi:hypothetical protein